MLAVTYTCFNQFYIVTMNTQLHSAIKATPYEVVFGMEASSEPVPSLKVVEEPAAASDEDDTDFSGNNSDTSFACTHNGEGS